MISTIVPVYRTYKYLYDCIRSIAAQTYAELEIILIDDGSDDESALVCDEWIEKDERICVIHQTNGGVSSARNVGIRMAGGEFLSFVDSDDLIAPCMLERLASALSIHDADIAACDYSSGSSLDNACAINGQDFPLSRPDVFRHLYIDLDITLAIVWAKLFKTSLFQGIVFPNIKKGEDNAVCFQIYQKIEKMIYLPDKLYFYRTRDDSCVHTFDESSAVDFDIFDDQMSFWEKCQNREFVRLCFERSFKRLLMTLDCSKNAQVSPSFIPAVKEKYNRCMLKHIRNVSGIGPIEKRLYLLDWTDGKPRKFAKNYIRIRIAMRTWHYRLT